MKRWITPALFAGAFTAIAIAERRRPLRRPVEPDFPRVGRNLAMGALTAIVTAALQKPLVDRVFRTTTRRRLGLLHRARLPRAVHFVASILLLDYTLWWWHRMNHVAPALWRFHRVHHIDRDLDVSTALRFHFGEMALAAFFRAAQVQILGVDASALGWWQRALLLSILFHHSNVRLPENLEREFVKVIVTPRMHGIHHSKEEPQTRTNLASLFSWWDMLHGTLDVDVPQPEIGAPDWDDSDEPGIGRLLVIPFQRSPEPPGSPRPAPSSR